MNIKRIEAKKLALAVIKLYPCIQSANFVILIHWYGDKTAFLPMRVALQSKSLGTWLIPDMLLVNADLPSGSKSPLLEFVVKEELETFRKLKLSGNIGLYINKNLSCVNRESQIKENKS